MSNGFHEHFKALTGHLPFPWQEALYERFLKREFPETCVLATGLGKTSIIAIWLIALAERSVQIPRRLVYVVNRRTVVDQTTDEVEKLRRNLDNHGPIQEALRELCAIRENGDGTPIVPLAISTLRGQFADNQEWSADPARPAVICGTVDMIGSRLLFSGYRIGFKSRPLHAGFLGQDALLIHDEAHLEPAFQQLLEDIHKEQKRCGELRKFHVIELSATARGTGKTFELTPEDAENETVRQRIGAKKALVRHELADEKKELVSRLVTLALAHQDSGRAILIFARTVEAVEQVAAALTKELKKAKLPDHVQTLTGTMRGLERDQLAESNAVFARFLPPANRSENVTCAEGAVYLVCTSAGEVGVNISADHLVCDLTTFDSMAQRFGRVNRFGNRDDTRIDIVSPAQFDDTNPYEAARQKTLDLLRQLNGNGSPQALGSLAADQRAAAFAPIPTILPTSDILFDAWSLTTIRDNMPGRPHVAPYLHGIADDQPQTTIVWRVELDLIDVKSPDAEKALDAIFKKHRIRPHETLTVGMTKQRGTWKFRAIEFLESVVAKRPDLRYAPVAIQFTRGLCLTTVEELIRDHGGLRADPTLILPASFGGLDKSGMLDADAVAKANRKQDESSTIDVEDLTSLKEADAPMTASLDIADKDGYEPYPKVPPRIRLLIERSDSGWSAREMPGGSPLPVEWQLDRWYEKSTQLVNDIRRKSKLNVRLVQEISFDEDDKPVLSIVFLSPAPPSGSLGEDQPLDEHVSAVESHAKRFVEALELEGPFRSALLFAAEWHDEGKKAERWQRYIGRIDPNVPLGKSAKWRNPKLLAGYRHEFGSLVRIGDEDRRYFANSQLNLTAQQQDDARDVALHLIAAHHGYARPHFDNPHDYDFPDVECEAIHLETIQRFARLQRKYGRWGLAYLESLLRSADWAASREIGLDPEADDDDATDTNGADT